MATDSQISNLIADLYQKIIINDVTSEQLVIITEGITKKLVDHIISTDISKLDNFFKIRVKYSVKYEQHSHPPPLYSLNDSYFDFDPFCYFEIDKNRINEYFDNDKNFNPDLSLFPREPELLSCCKGGCRHFFALSAELVRK